VSRVDSRRVDVKVPALFNGISMQPPQVRLPNQVAYAVNCVFSVVDGVSKRPGSWMEYDLGTSLHKDGNWREHPIVRDDNERYSVVYGTYSGSTSLRVFPIPAGQEATVTLGSGVQTYLDLYSGDMDRLRVVTIADTTIIVNSSVPVAYSEQSGSITGNTVASPTVITSAGHGLSSGQRITITGSNSTPSIDGSHIVTVTTANTFTIPVNVTGAGTAGTWYRGSLTASSMPVEMQRTGVARSGVAITSNSAANPTVVTAASHGLVTGQSVTITGQTGAVSINSTYTVTVTGTNTFTIPVDCTGGAGTGGTLTAKALFTVSQIAWNERASGTPTTNPVPSLWADGIKIADLSFARGRLVLGGRDRVVMSQADDLFNFWVETAGSVIDSDRIDLGIASDEAIEIDYFQPIRKSVLVFCRGGRQFELGADGAMTPTSARVTPTTRVRTLQARPAAIDPSVFFCSADDYSAQLHEFQYDEVALPSTTEEVSAHVRDLMFIWKPSTEDTARIRTIVSSPKTGNIFVLRTDFADPFWRGTDVFVYATFRRSDERVQSAWTRWEFGSDLGVHDMAVVDRDLVLLRGQTIAGSWRVFIERIPIMPESSHRVS